MDEALEYAEAQGWTVEKATEHAWGRLYCPCNDAECRYGEFCIVSVWSTPKNPNNHVRQLKRVVDNCTTHRRISILSSSLLADRRADILERWTQRIGREHVDKELSRGQLWDHLPLFHRLLSGNRRGAAVVKGASGATMRGSTRIMAYPATAPAPKPGAKIRAAR